MAFPISTLNKRIIAEYQISVTTSPSAAQSLLLLDYTNTEYPGKAGQVILAAKGADITFLFGNSSSISASRTPTANLLPVGNFTVLSGAIYAVSILGTDNYVSAVGSGAGTAIIQIVEDLT